MMLGAGGGRSFRIGRVCYRQVRGGCGGSSRVGDARRSQLSITLPGHVITLRPTARVTTRNQKAIVT
eukprot:6194182-Pleurochrysis_carterae.AAC.2